MRKTAKEIRNELITLQQTVNYVGMMFISSCGLDRKDDFLKRMNYLYSNFIYFLNNETLMYNYFEKDDFFKYDYDAYEALIKNATDFIETVASEMCEVRNKKQLAKETFDFAELLVNNILKEENNIKCHESNKVVKENNMGTSKDFFEYLERNENEIFG